MGERSGGGPGGGGGGGGAMGPRLYLDGRVMSFKRSKVNQYTGTTLLTIDGVNTKEEADWYLGKRVAYIYKAKTKKAGPNGPTKFRCVWGKVPARTGPAARLGRSSTRTCRRSLWGGRCGSCSTPATSKPPGRAGGRPARRQGMSRGGWQAPPRREEGAEVESSHCPRPLSKKHHHNISGRGVTFPK